MADEIVQGGLGGIPLAADSIGGLAFQRIKLVSGADNANDGDVDNALPLPVNAADRTDVIQNGNTQLTPKFAVIDDAASGDNTILAAVTSKKIRVIACFLISAGTVTARFEDGAGGTALTGQITLAANTGFVLPYCPVGWFETGVTTLLNLELSDAISVDGSLVYVEA